MTLISFQRALVLVFLFPVFCVLYGLLFADTISLNFMLHNYKIQNRTILIIYKYKYKTLFAHRKLFIDSCLYKHKVSNQMSFKIRML